MLFIYIYFFKTRALQLLKSCELLKISDILPYFPDFVLIEDFKVFHIILYII